MHAWRIRGRSAGAVTVIAAALIVSATLTPGSASHAGAISESCRFECAESLISDVVRNVLLFFPLGIGLRLAGVRWRTALGIAALFSGAVELLQIGVVSGRDASIHDWISNSAGGGMGWLVAAHVRDVLYPSRSRARVFLGAAVGLWLSVLLLGAWGIGPAPTSSPFWGQRAPDLGDLPTFAGELLSARVNGEEIPSARMPNDRGVRRALQEGRVRVDAVVRRT